MAQPKSAPRPELPRIEQLAKLLDPLGLVVLTRERVAEALDDAVQRGRMTRADAQELATALITRGRESTEDLIGEIEQRLGRQRADAAAGAAKRPAKSTRRATLPIEGYDDLTAAQITGRLADLTPAELRRVRDHEQRNANRKSVLQAVDRRLA